MRRACCASKRFWSIVPGFLIASSTAFFVISLKSTRWTFFRRGPSFLAMCQAIASPSRSGSGAR